MPDPVASNYDALQSRYNMFADLYRQLLEEANADGIITPEEQAGLDQVQSKLIEIERRLNERPESDGEGFLSDPLGSLADVASDIVDGVVDTAGDLVEGAEGIIETVAEAATGGGGGGGGASGLVEDIVDGASDAAGDLVDTVSDLVDGAGGVLGDAAGLLSDLVQTFTGTAAEIALAARDAAREAAGLISSTVQSAADRAEQEAQAAVQAAVDRANEAAERAEQAANEAEEATGDALESLRQRAEEAATEARAAAAEVAELVAARLADAEAQVREAGQQVADAAQNAADQAEDAVETAVTEASEAAEDAREQASEVEREVRELASSALEFATGVAGQLGGLIDGARTAIENILNGLVTEAQAAADRAEEAVRRFTGTYYTDEENETLAELEAAGLDQQEREAIVDAARGDPAVLAHATATLARMEEMNVPAADRGELIRLAQTNQDGFDAAMEVISGMETGGPLDVSGEAMADLTIQRNEARAERTAKYQAMRNLIDSGAPEAEVESARAEYESARTSHISLRDDLSQREGKRKLLDALSFGPLSVDQEDPIPPEDANALIEAYGRNPDVADTAAQLAGDAEDPSLIAQNVDAVLDLSESGFAGPDGTPLAENRSGEFDGMAENMLRNGAAMGQEYFDGAQAYFDSGAQAIADPCGGRDQSPRRDVGDVNNSRTAMMGTAMLDSEGNVDVTSDGAQAAMDHMLYHPGSLADQSYSPNVTDQMRGVYDMFNDPETSGDASEVINGVEAPTNPGALNIVSQTMDIPEGDVTDESTRAAVLSGMLAPFQQGNVGSCFATGPARRQRIEDPVQSMRNMAEIATTGQFSSPGLNVPIPANQNIPDGENPLMRSYEYTIASGSAMLTNSTKHERLDDALWDAADGGRGLGEIEGIVGADAWNGSGSVADGDLEIGIESRIRTALAQNLRFDYDATEAETPAGGGGDGSSSHGVFEIVYGGSVIETEAEFQDAILAIAVGAIDDPDQATSDAISELIQSAGFVNSVYAAYGTDRAHAPWNMRGGGWGTEAEQVLTGEEEEYSEISASGGSGPQAEEILNNLVANMGGDEGLRMITTLGSGASHVFMGMPKIRHFRQSVVKIARSAFKKPFLAPVKPLPKHLCQSSRPIGCINNRLTSFWVGTTFAAMMNPFRC